MGLKNFVIQLANEKPTKLLLNAFLPKVTRRKWRSEYDAQKKERVSARWDLYIGNPNLVVMADLVLKANDALKGEKIIWQYWAQGFDDLPEIVRLCYKSVDKYADDYQIIRVSDKDLKDYLIFPDFVRKIVSSGFVKSTHFSDLLRVALLYHYGGVWIDSTILLTGGLPKQCESDSIFMFSRDFNSEFRGKWPINHFYFDWSEGALVRHLSSFMSAKKENREIKLILGLLLTFWQKEGDFGHYFFFQILLQKLKEKKLALNDMPIFDDALPHLLVDCLGEEFDRNEFDSLLKKTTVHKLDWRLSPVDVSKSGGLTYYGHIKNILI